MYPGRSNKKCPAARGGSEEGGAGWILDNKRLRKFRSDLIGGLGDTGPDRSPDAASIGADRFHPSYRSFDYPAEYATPTAMRRTNHAGDRVLNRIGAQSAVRTPSAISGTRVTKLSALGAASGRHGLATAMARAL